MKGYHCSDTWCWGCFPGAAPPSTTQQKLEFHGEKWHLHEWHCPAALPLGSTPPQPHISPLSHTYPLFLAGHECLEAGRDTEAQLMDVGWLILAVDLDTDASFERCLICGRWKGRVGSQPCPSAACLPTAQSLSHTPVHPSTHISAPAPPVSGSPAAPLTGLPPDRQVFLLLDVQHDLQPVAHATLAGHSRVPPVPIESVALAVTCIDLKMEMERDGEEPSASR